MEESALQERAQVPRQIRAVSARSAQSAAVPMAADAPVSEPAMARAPHRERSAPTAGAREAEPRAPMGAAMRA